MEQIKKKRIYAKWQGLRVRATPEEIARIRARARAYGFGFSQFIRQSCMSSVTKPRIPEDVRRAISGFGRNLNQLSYHANSTGTAAEVQAVEALRRDAQEIIRALAEITEQ